MCYLRVQDNVKVNRFGIPVWTTTEINEFISYANAEFILTGIFIFVYIISHAVFSVRYWALSKKIENLLKSVYDDKKLNIQSIVLFSIILVICTTGVISMTCEMCLINKR